jgi:hypothetical protein
MYYSTIALATLFAVTMTPTPIAAKTVLPNLSDPTAVDEDYDCQVHLNTDKDTKASPEEIAMFEQALILSANEVYGKAELHLDKAAVKTAKHGPKALITVEGGINDNNVDMSKNLLRGQAEVERPDRWSLFSTYYGVVISATCDLCRNRNDGEAFMDTAFLMATEKGVKKGKKGGNKHALWEETLCDLLNQTPAFDNAEDCEIVVTKKGEMEPVLDGAMGVVTTEIVDKEEERN